MTLDFNNVPTIQVYISVYKCIKVFPSTHKCIQVLSGSVNMGRSEKLRFTPREPHSNVEALPWKKHRLIIVKLSLNIQQLIVMANLLNT